MSSEGAVNSHISGYLKKDQLEISNLQKIELLFSVFPSLSALLEGKEEYLGQQIER